MNVGRGMLGLNVVVAVALAGWFGWKQWFDPSNVYTSFGSQCGWIDHSRQSSWTTFALFDASDEALTVSRMSITSDGLVVGRVVAMPAGAGFAPEYGVADLPKQSPALFYASRPPVGTIAARGSNVRFYIETSWAPTTSRARLQVDVAYRTSAGFGRELVSTHEFSDFTSSTPECPIT